MKQVSKTAFSALIQIWIDATFLGKQSTSPVKVVNCSQREESTKSVWVDKLQIASRANERTVEQLFLFYFSLNRNLYIQ